MAESDERIRVVIAGVKETKEGFKEIRTAADETNTSLKKGVGLHEELGKASDHATRAFSRFRSAASYAGGLFGITALGYGVRDVFTSGIQAQEQQALLNRAIQNTGIHGDAAHRSLQKLNAQAEKTATHGGFSTEEQANAQLRFLNQLGSVDKAEKANYAAMVVSRQGHMSYAQSISLLSQAETGRVNRLERYLGPIQKVTYFTDQLTAKEKKLHPELKKRAELEDRQATAAEINQKISEKFKGGLETYSNTAAGAVSNANNAWKTAITLLGQKLLPTITDVANAFREVVEEMTKGEGIWGTVGRDITVTWEALKETWKWLEKNKEVAKLVGGVIATAFAVEKINKFTEALKGLQIVQIFAGGKVKNAEGGAKSAGKDLGSVFGKAFIAAAVAAGIYDFLKNSKTERPLEEAWDAISGEENKFEREHKANEKKEREEFLKKPEIKKDIERRHHTDSVAEVFRHVHNPTLRHRDEQYAREHPQQLLHAHIKLDVDGKTFATVLSEHILHNPTAERKVAEAVTHHTTKLQARNR